MKIYGIQWWFIYSVHPNVWKFIFMGTYWEMLWDFLVKHRKQIRYSSKDVETNSWCWFKNTGGNGVLVGLSGPSADGMAYGPGVLSTHCRNLTSWDHIRRERFESTNLFVLKTIQFLRVSKFHPIYLCSRDPHSRWTKKTHQARSNVL